MGVLVGSGALRMPAKSSHGRSLFAQPGQWGAMISGLAIRLSQACLLADFGREFLDPFAKLG
jgi:hypothetical protein